MPHSIQKSLFNLVLVCLLLGAAGNSRAACDNCPERSVVLYDFDVSVPKPDSLAERVARYSHFYGASAAGSTIFTPPMRQVHRWKRLPR